MKMSDVVKKLDLGNSVAEFDESLEKYFVETEPFRQLVTNKVDIVAGDKGTGKTAIFRVLRTRYARIPSPIPPTKIRPRARVSASPVATDGSLLRRQSVPRCSWPRISRPIRSAASSVGVPARGTCVG